jgi:hypothetical protein
MAAFLKARRPLLYFCYLETAGALNCFHRENVSKCEMKAFSPLPPQIVSSLHRQ